MEVCCGNCMFWRKKILKGDWKPQYGYGNCHRYPPQVYIGDWWPKTIENEFCGEFKPKEQENEIGEV